MSQHQSASSTLFGPLSSSTSANDFNQKVKSKKQQAADDKQSIIRNVNLLLSSPRNFSLFILCLFLFGVLIGKVFYANKAVPDFTETLDVKKIYKTSNGEEDHTQSPEKGETFAALDAELLFLKTTTQKDHRKLVQHQFQSLMRKYSSEQFNNDVFKIERIQKPAADYFFKNFVAKNKPVIITGEINLWPANKKWTEDYLRKKAGISQLSVNTAKSGSSEQHIDMTMNEFLDSLKKSSKSANKQLIAEASITEQLPMLAEDVPKIPSFVSDIMEWKRTKLSIATSGQTIPMHFEELEEILCQLEGTRKVTLFDPSQADLMHMVYPGRGDSKADPLIHKLDKKRGDASKAFHDVPLFKYAKPLTVELKAGEILYVPSMWTYHVEIGSSKSMALHYQFLSSSPSQQPYWLMLTSGKWRNIHDPNEGLVLNRRKQASEHNDAESDVNIAVEVNDDFLMDDEGTETEHEND